MTCRPFSHSLTISLIFSLFVLQCFTQSQLPTQQAVITTQSPQSNQLVYTENIEEFKSKKYNQRLQMVVGCWLLSKYYLEFSKSTYLFFKDHKLKEIVMVKLVKECMKKITRKEAILKITELVGKNMQPAKKYENLVDKAVIDSIFIQVNKLSIKSYHQPQKLSQEIILNTNSQNVQNQGQNPAQNAQNPSSTENTNQTIQSQSTSSINSQQQQPRTQIQSNQMVQTTPVPSESEPSTGEQEASNSFSEFDLFLNDLIKKYNEQFSKLIGSKEGLKGRVEEELKKRQKYYFGFIPASSFTHSVFLVTISLSMVFCCTCYKYYKMRSNEKAQRKMKMSEQQEDDCGAHSHSKLKQCSKRVAKMSQLTMKKKVK